MNSGFAVGSDLDLDLGVWEGVRDEVFDGEEGATGLVDEAWK